MRVYFYPQSNFERQGMSSQNSDPAQNSTYSAKSIRVMEGLEAVRKRPGMYIGTTGPSGLHHLVYEVVDNSVDEALAGHCDTINVTLHEDGSCSVMDNGRGIPTDIHAEEGVSATEVVLTKLHAGGKFDKDSYKFSGGLHGVGVSVVNALSSTLEVTVFQNGKEFHQTYHQGKPAARLAVVGPSNKRGTLVRFYPDPEIFKETVEFNYDRIAARFRELAFLNKGLTINVADERTNKEEHFFFEGGIVSFVEHVNRKKTPLFPEVIFNHYEGDDCIFECAFQYNDGYDEQLFSFVNNINTADGGTHVSGFKAALTKACNKRALELGLLKADDTFSSDDVREGLVCVLSIKIPEPQFEGQTKGKLGNSEVKGLVSSWFFNFLDTYFEENPAIARKIFQKALITMQAREAARKARDITRRKNVLESTVLPGKLADCSSDDPSKSELFIVEGDSAGGSAKNARDRFTQAILPLRGKILNVEKARLDRALSNEEIKALIAAVGCGINKDTFDITAARYHKIILMTDADVDGSHIRTLLLTFFFRYMKPLIEHGYLYIAQPPLYKVKIGKKEQYLKDERSFKHFLINWAEESTRLICQNTPLSNEELRQLLADLEAYDQHLESVSNILHIAPSDSDGIAAAISQSDWYTKNDLDALHKALISALSDRTVTIEKTAKTFQTEDGTVQEGEPETVIVFSSANHTLKVPLKLLAHTELRKAGELQRPLSKLTQPWTLELITQNKSFEGQGIRKLSSMLKEASKPYMNIQRYKGLGEMNPDQLGETAMDATSRSLLQVTLDDEVKADLWFTTLMGDDVAGRRTFIEERGHFAKNIDA